MRERRRDREGDRPIEHIEHKKTIKWCNGIQTRSTLLTLWKVQNKKQWQRGHNVFGSDHLARGMLKNRKKKKGWPYCESQNIVRLQPSVWLERENRHAGYAHKPNERQLLSCPSFPTSHFPSILLFFLFFQGQDNIFVIVLWLGWTGKEATRDPRSAGGLIV